MCWRAIKRCVMLGLGLCSAGGVMAVEADSLFLSVGQLFQLGIENSLHIQADRLSELQAEEQSRTARTSRLPDLQLGLSGAYVGQPIVFQRGLSQPSRPETPTGRRATPSTSRSRSIKVGGSGGVSARPTSRNR